MSKKAAIPVIVLLVISTACCGGGWYMTLDTLDRVETTLGETQYELDRAMSQVENLGQQVESLEDEIVDLEVAKASLQSSLEAEKLLRGKAEEKLDLFRDTYGEVYSNIPNPYCVFQASGETKPTSLVNNKEAINPTWADLKAFLWEDPTDSHQYLDPVYMCGNFAEELHNSAERAGLRAAVVMIGLEEDSYHALNAFKTTDRGLIFIDCTGVPPNGARPRNCDKVAEVELSKEYKAKSIFPNLGWESYWESMGTVEEVRVYW